MCDGFLRHNSARANCGILDQRVTDGVIRRMIDKWLKAGVLEEVDSCALRLKVPRKAASSHQCSRTSSCTTCWMNGSRRSDARMLGECTLVRFADQLVMTFKNHRDAKRVLEVLGKRLARYGLTLHPDKTRFVKLRPERKGGTHPDCWPNRRSTFLASPTPGRSH